MHAAVVLCVTLAVDSSNNKAKVLPCIWCLYLFGRPGACAEHLTVTASTGTMVAPCSRRVCGATSILRSVLRTRSVALCCVMLTAASRCAGVGASARREWQYLTVWLCCISCARVGRQPMWRDCCQGPAAGSGSTTAWWLNDSASSELILLHVAARPDWLSAVLTAQPICWLHASVMPAAAPCCCCALVLADTASP